MPTLRREVVVSGDGNCLYRTVALWKDEISEGKHEEIPRSSDSLFENDPKVFERPLFSLNSLEDLVSKIKIRRTPAETVDLYSVVHCSLSNPFVWRKIPFKIQSGYFPYRKINFRDGNQLTGSVIVQISLLSAISRV